MFRLANRIRIVGRNTRLFTLNTSTNHFLPKTIQRGYVLFRLLHPTWSRHRQNTRIVTSPYSPLNTNIIPPKGRLIFNLRLYPNLIRLFYRFPNGAINERLSNLPLHRYVRAIYRNLRPLYTPPTRPRTRGRARRRRSRHYYQRRLRRTRNGIQ